MDFQNYDFMSVFTVKHEVEIVSLHPRNGTSFVISDIDNTLRSGNLIFDLVSIFNRDLGADISSEELTNAIEQYKSGKHGAKYSVLNAVLKKLLSIPYIYLEEAVYNFLQNSPYSLHSFVPRMFELSKNHSFDLYLASAEPTFIIGGFIKYLNSIGIKVNGYVGTGVYIDAFGRIDSKSSEYIRTDPEKKDAAIYLTDMYGCGGISMGDHPDDFGMMETCISRGGYAAVVGKDLNLSHLMRNLPQSRILRIAPDDDQRLEVVLAEFSRCLLSLSEQVVVMANS